MKTIKLTWPMLGALLLQGCITSYVGWTDKGAPLDTVSYGKYDMALKSRGNSGIVYQKVKTEKKDTAEIPADNSALPIEVGIILNATGECDHGELEIVNNVISGCTLGIWPWISSEKMCYTVSAKPENGEAVCSEVIVCGRKWSSFIIPFALIPCPGLGEVRGYGNTNLKAFADKRCADEVAFLLNKEFYENGMSKYVSAKKQWHQKKMTAIKKLQEFVESKKTK